MFSKKFFIQRGEASPLCRAKKRLAADSGYALRLTAVLLCAITTLCAACSPRSSLSVTPKAGLVCDFSLSLEGAAADIVNSFAAINNAHSAFNASELESSLKKSGFDSVSVTSATNTRLAFKAQAQDAQKVFASSPNAIVYAPPQNGKNANLSVTVSPRTVSQILSLFPPSAAEYMDFFLAPLFSPPGTPGVPSSEAEYIETIKAVYGQETAAALAKSNFVFSFTAPGAITKAEAPAFAKVEQTASTALFTIPLSALLSLTQSAVFSVGWN
jgi:hypothetical protein